MTILTFDKTGNLKSTHIADFLSGRVLDENGNPAVAGGVTSIDAHNTVAWLFRGVSLRASLVARMPFALMKGDTEVTDDPAYESWLKGFRQLLFKTEAVKCLTGAAYWLLETNAAGYNGRPRWVLPQSMQPKYNPATKELLHFYRRESNPPEIPLDKVVYFWNPNYRAENAPGPGEAQVVLGPASTLLAMDRMVAQFFNLGAVKVTVFGVPKEMQDPEKERFQGFLDRRLSGLRAAFRNIVMRGEIKPTVIGSDIKDTEAPELTALKRDDVAVGLGLAPSVLDGTSANFATAESDAFGTMVNTIIPECELLFETANEQLFSRIGVELVAKPEELEIMQSAQLTQVQAVATAVGGPVLSRNEGRDLLGYEPMCPNCDAVNPPDPTTGQAVTNCAVCGEPMNGKKPAPAPIMPPQMQPGMQPGDTMPAALTEPLTKSLTAWRKAAVEAVNSGRPHGGLVAFSERIPLALWNEIDGELSEARTAAAVGAVFERHWPRPIEAPDYAPLVEALREATAALRDDA